MINYLKIQKKKKIPRTRPIDYARQSHPSTDQTSAKTGEKKYYFIKISLELNHFINY